jgi:hypothetical protein
MVQKIVAGIWVGLLSSLMLHAQEQVAPVNYNPFLPAKAFFGSVNKTTALSLPFFEDFTNYNAIPDAARWVDRSVYVNNTMAFQPISRGVATFDGLNDKGGPYDSTSATVLLYADSLTSQPIDLSINTPADSIYLSFFYQPQGNGFAPEKQDSLMLYLRNNNGEWIKFWSDSGTSVRAFRQVMIPVSDTVFFYNTFQFRFVNKASLNLNDDVWNVDYIRMAAGRNINDTLVNDVATTLEPSFLLNDYTSMPYRQFLVNPGAVLSPQHYFYVKNNYSFAQNISYGYIAREQLSNTGLFTNSLTNTNLTAFTEQQFSFPVYPISFTAPGIYSKVVLEDKYYVSPVSPSDPRENDTIVKEQVFDNYLAYDDGTAEKSYFLNLFATLPGKTAIEFDVKQPDTLRGVAIYFGRTVPLATSKFFSIFVYKSIAFGGGVDDTLYHQDLLFPGYIDTQNHFWVYRFDTPVPLAAGTFYVGTSQPANSGSDSLYFGLDVNRIGGNHLYYNVLDQWQSSSISGALMVRPLLGQGIAGTSVGAVKPDNLEWSISPNPVSSQLYIETTKRLDAYTYLFTDMAGRTVLKGKGASGKPVDVSAVQPGIYFIRILYANQVSSSKKFIKL